VQLLLSDHLEPDPSRADLFWVYGCPNGDTVLPMLRWIKRTFPFWKAAVQAGVAKHAIAVGHEEGWAEVPSHGSHTPRVATAHSMLSAR
jgi:hypothetical protein